MATISTFTYPNAVAQVDLNSYTAYKDLPKKVACNNQTPNSDGNSWNCNLCPGDNAYMQPVLRGDSLFFQLHLADTINAGPGFTYGWNDGSSDWFVDADIMDLDGNVIEDSFFAFVTEFIVGRDKDGLDFQNLQIDIPQNTEWTCFQIRFTHKLSDGSLVYYFSEAFEIIDTEDESCLKTMLMEGLYSGYDCEGNFYGEGAYSLGSSNSKYRNVHRFYGNSEFETIETQKESNDNNVVIRIKNFDIYHIKMDLIPPYEVDRLTAIVRAPEIFIDGISFFEFSGLSKNNEIGRMWLPDFTAKTTCGDGTLDVFGDCK